ncbi:metal-dependent hydrolase [Ferrimicrobium sp.]|uniref:metal-dependent hydrolase n=1 Tax=Ferrimicrobium sp. TaxID=2926050 RepID=UPI0026270E1B|nr:metal-dependent hydrolase [Ferrimicrobium sp.]
MQTRNKAVIVGLVAGSIVWNTTRVLPYGIEAGVLACWAGCLPDLDGAYEFAGDHAKYPPATLTLPFGRTIVDRVQSVVHVKFLHSVVALIAFVALGELVTLLPSTIYAHFQMFLAGWLFYVFAKYFYKTILRHLIQDAVSAILIYWAITGFVIWALVYEHFPGFHPLPARWFVLTLVLGFGGSVAIELFSARGIPLLWPSTWRVRIPILAETGGVREVIAVVVFVSLWCCWWWYHYPTFHLVAMDLGAIFHLMYQDVFTKIESFF